MTELSTTPADSAAIQTRQTPKHSGDLTSIDCYFHDLPSDSRMRVVKQLIDAWSDCIFFAKNPIYAIFLFFPAHTFDRVALVVAWVSVSICLTAPLNVYIL